MSRLMIFSRALRAVIIGGLAIMASPFFTPAYAGEPASSARSRAAITRQTPDLRTALEAQDLKLGAPVFLRIIKTNPDGAGYRGGRIEAFVQKKEGGAFTLFKTYDICAYSGRLGPKTQQGDNQAPEGFYFVTPSAMNPYSSYHLSFNLGYPNAYDRSHGRTGNYLMVHGKCGSIGCYAMGNAGVEEIYTLMSAAFAGGQSFVRVHAFPFDMSPAALARHKDSAHAAFWANLKQGWDAFELAHIPPDTRVENGRYIFENAAE